MSKPLLPDSEPGLSRAVVAQAVSHPRADGSSETSLRLPQVSILGTHVNAVSMEEAVGAITSWTRDRKGRYICATSVHMVMEGWDSTDYQQVVNGADMATPDGMPVAWCLRKAGYTHQKRVCGPDLMWELLKAGSELRWRIGLLGGAQSTLDRLDEKISQEFPGLTVAMSVSPPFRKLTEQEDAELVRQINDSNLDILFIAFGCPKQERWMFDHRHRVHTVMHGVGAAFQFHAGELSRAPKWMQQAGLEWVYRLCSEPKRLWQRYTKHNFRFIWWAGLVDAISTKKRVFRST